MISQILPMPKSVKPYEGTTTVPLAVYTQVPEWQIYVAAFCDYTEKLTGERPVTAEGGLELIRDASLERSAYILDTVNGVRLSAADDEGACYALSTALQALQIANGQISAERAVVLDQPDKPYRSLMVDLARKWHPVRTLLKYIDMCFAAKLRYLHLHFIDDQSYTLPSKAFPKVNGSCRFYSHEDIRTVCAYAKARGVVLIPEFEAPGHAKFLIRHYPAVFENHIPPHADTAMVTETGDLFTTDSILCAGRKACEEGIRTLLREICEMFPDSPYIHIGGDEVNLKAWKYCPDCLQYMAENDIADEHALYSDFVARVSQMVLDMGRTPIVWEGFSQKGSERIPRETIVMAWETHYHMPYDLVDEGFRIINCSWQPLYIIPSFRKRWGVPEILRWNVYNWQHWWEKSEAFLNPIHLPASDNVLGAQLCSWEQTYEHEVGLIMENHIALAERTWNVKRTLDDEAFYQRYKHYADMLARIVADTE